MPRTSGTFPKGTNGPGKGGSLPIPGRRPAKGYGTDVKVELFTTENQPVPNPVKVLGRKEREARNAERAEIIEGHIFRLAQSAEREDTLLRAAEYLWNRYEGAPVARQQISGPDEGPVRIEETRKPIKQLIAESIARVKDAERAGNE